MKKPSKKHTWALQLFLSLYLIRQLFNVMDYPYAKFISIAAATIIIVFYPLRYVAKPNKIMLDHVKMAWIFAYSIQVLFSLLNYYPLTVFRIILFFYWFFREGYIYIYKLFKTSESKEKNLLDDFEEETRVISNDKIIDGILVFGGFLIFCTKMFDIINPPFSTLLFLVGYPIAIIAIWFKDFE